MSTIKNRFIRRTGTYKKKFGKKRTSFRRKRIYKNNRLTAH